MKNFRKALSIFVAVCFAFTALCSFTAFAAEETYMEVLYSRDFTKLTGTEGTWSEDKIDYSIDDVQVGSLNSTSTGKYEVTVGEEGINAGKPYFFYDKSLSGKYEVSGSFKSGNNGANNQLRFLLNFNKNDTDGGSTNIQLPFDGAGYILTVTNYSPDNVTKAFRIKLSTSSTTLDSETYKVEKDFRFTEGNPVDFVLSYDYPTLSLTLSEAERGFSETFTFDLSLYEAAASARTYGYFGFDDKNTSSSGMTLRNLTVKQEYIAGMSTLFEEDFNALLTTYGVSGGTNYDKYDIDSLGWSTYATQTNSAVASSKATGQMELFSGSTPKGLTSSGSGTAVFNENLGQRFNIDTNILVFSTSEIKFWFNAEFNGTTPVSGFCLTLTSGKNASLIYTDGTNEYQLYSTTTTGTYTSNGSVHKYILDYADGTLSVDLQNNSDDFVINVFEKLDENNITGYNTSGKYGVQSTGTSGFMDIRTVSVSAASADVTLAEKITDGDVITTSAVYHSPDLVNVNVIAAAYDATGALIGVDIKVGTTNTDKVDFEITKTISSDVEEIKFFLIDNLDRLTPICQATEVTVY